MRWTIYVDFDAYYVSCERRDRPELEGRPVIVGPDPKLGPSRGVVLSASYEARANGVHSAMPAAQAAQRCPEATWIAPDFEKYGRVAHEVREYLRSRFERVSALSIDEAAIAVDLPDRAAAEAAARSLQADLTDRFRLPCSIGVAASRTVAKIATDEAKPGGLRIVPPEETETFLAPLPVRAIPGVGPKTAEILEEVGARTIGELRSLPLPVRRRLGRFGEELYRLARGEAPVEPNEEVGGPRSRSTDRTFLRDTDDPVELAAAVEALAEELARALAQEQLRYRTVTVALRWEDFQRSQRSRTVAGLQEGAEALRREARRLLDDLLSAEAGGRHRRVRTVSVGAEKLSHAADKQSRLDQFSDGAPAHR